VNCLVAGRPHGAALAIAGAVLASVPDAPVTLMSDDTPGLLAALDRPELGGAEVLWADPSVPGTVDDALVHRRMLHGRPDVVVAVVDAEQGAADLATVLAPRLGGTPLVLTGDGAAAAASAIRALLEEAGGEGTAPAVVPGHDAAAVLRVATDLVRRAVRPADDPAPLLSGHCAH
jgi:hypothetical protein